MWKVLFKNHLISLKTQFVMLERKALKETMFIKKAKILCFSFLQWARVYCYFINLLAN